MKKFILFIKEGNQISYRQHSSVLHFTNVVYGVLLYINEKAPYFYEANYFVLFASTNKTKPNKLMKLKDK